MIWRTNMMYEMNSMISTWFWVILILIIIAAFVANDASKRGHNGLLWGFLVVIMPMMGIFFYLIFVSLNPVANTPVSQKNASPRNNQQQYQQTNNYYKDDEPNDNPNQGIAGKFCVSCGSSNVEFAEFCNKCGAKIPSN